MLLLTYFRSAMKTFNNLLLNQDGFLPNLLALFRFKYLEFENRITQKSISNINLGFNSQILKYLIGI